MVNLESSTMKKDVKSRQGDMPKNFPTEADMRQYPTLAVMKELKVPLTRESYLELAYLKPNPQISPEEESELPEPFRRNL